MSFEKTYFEEETINSPIDFSRKEFIDCTISNINISNSELSNSIFIETTFIKVDLSNCSLVGASFRDCKFKDCKLVGLNWSSTKSTNHIEVSGSICDFNVFQEMKVTQLKFTNSRFRDCDFFKANLTQSKFENCDFLNSNFNGSNLTNVDFSDSENYVIDPSSSITKGTIISVNCALEIINNMGIEVNLGH